MLRQVIEELETMGLTISFRDNIEGSYFDSVDNEIVLDAGMGGDETVFTLLHEAGHADLHFDDDDYQCTFPAKVSPHRHSFETWITEFRHEESMAWFIGRQIAERLDLGLDFEAYDKLADTCLADYEAWFTEVDCREQHRMLSFSRFADFLSQCA